jgi:prepilin-type processing-associated H-X9-DG protein
MQLFLPNPLFMHYGNQFPSYVRSVLGSWIGVEVSLYASVFLSIPLEACNDNGDTSHHIPFETYICPSSDPVGIVNDWYGARGNYAANAGIGFVWMNDPSPWQDCTNKQFSCQDRPYSGNNGPNLEKPKSSLSRFGTFQVNRGRKMAEFIDGTSKTAAVCEVRTYEGTDTRGTLHFGAAAMYMHDFVPNFKDLPDWTRYCADGLTATQCRSTQVTGGEWRGQYRQFARSSHPGGVNLLAVDGSVRFVPDDVDENIWKSYATPNGEENFGSL